MGRQFYYHFHGSCERHEGWNFYSSASQIVHQLFRHRIIQFLIILDNIVNVTILADGCKMLAGTRYLAIHHLLGHRQRELNTPVEHTSKEQVEVVSVGLDIIQE